MSTINTEQVKDTIRKLLNLSRDNAATEGEVNNAIRFATKLMDQHNLSEDDLSQAEDKLQGISSAPCNRAEVVTTGLRLRSWESYLASFVCSFLGVKYYLPHKEGFQRDSNGIIQRKPDGNPKEGRIFTFYGIAEDVALATQLYLDLSATIVSMSYLRYGSPNLKDGLQYAEGFVQGLWDAYKSQQIDTKETAQLTYNKSGSSTALVLVEKRKEILEAKKERAKSWLTNDLGITLGRGKANYGYNRTHSNPEARKQGIQDGKSQNPSVNRTKKLSSK